MIFLKNLFENSEPTNNNEYELYSILPVFGNFDPILKEFIVSSNKVNFLIQV